MCVIELYVITTLFGFFSQSNIEVPQYFGEQCKQNWVQWKWKSAASCRITWLPKQTTIQVNSNPCSAWSVSNHVWGCHNTLVTPFWIILTRTCHQIYQNSLISPEVSYRNIWCPCLWKCPYTGHFLIFPHPYLLYRSRRASLTLFHVACKYAPCYMQLPLIRGVFRAKMVNPDSTASRKHVLLLIVDTRL